MVRMSHSLCPGGGPDVLNSVRAYIYYLVPHTVLTHAAGLDSLIIKGDVILARAINGI